MTQWYNLSDLERAKNVYSKYKIKDFWDWWSNENSVMEVRIQDWELSKKLGYKFNIPFSSSGVYVSDDTQLKNIIGAVRDKKVVWFGINPRKRNIDRWGRKTYGGGERGGSGDVNVEAIKFLFIDIDRIKKDGWATNQDLEHANYLCDKILEKLSVEGWNRSYCKICSGNGVQLILKLDEPINMPNYTFKEISFKDKINYTPDFNEEAERIKKVIKEGIGKEIVRYCNQIVKKEKLNVMVDNTCFRLSNVGALHCTKNLKFDGFRWRGLIELKNGKNEGLSDYILTKQIKHINRTNIFTGRVTHGKYLLKPGKLRQNPLINFFLNNDFPEGGINNTYWFQIKCLLRDSKIDLNSEEFRSIHQELRAKHRRDFSMNIPDKKYAFSSTVINRWQINKLQPLIYPLYDDKIKIDSKLEDYQWSKNNIRIMFRNDDDKYKSEEYKINLDNETELNEDLFKLKEDINNGDYNNIIRVNAFLNAVNKKYNKETVDYLLKDNFLYEFLSYKKS